MSSSAWRRIPADKIIWLAAECPSFDYDYSSSSRSRNSSIPLDLQSKLSVLKVSPSVVSLVSHTGKKKLFICSGTIIECEESNGTFFSTILTSASLIRCPSRKAVVALDIKVDVYLSDGKLFEGHVSNCDFHYNISTIKIRSDVLLPTAVLRHLDDSMLVNPSALNVDQSNLFKLCPGERVVVLRRHHLSYKLMTKLGEFSACCCDFDCQELFMASCKTTKNGIGGPLINGHGEVIGISFYHKRYTPFLPINIVSKCLEDFKKDGRVRRPLLGMKVSNLYTASIGQLETIVKKFPSICRGVIVEKVLSMSPADCAGILPDDVIVQCGGHDVGCLLEFFGIMWDKAGESVEVVLMREKTNACVNLTMVVDEKSPANYYRWPVPKKKNRDLKFSRSSRKILRML